MLGGSFARSFLMPGTNTSIRVGGFVDETFDYYFQNGPPNGTQSTTVGITGNLATQALDIHGQTVPGLPTPGNLAPVNITHSRGRVFLQSPRETRLSVETRTPTDWGDSRSFIEFDFAGCNNFSCQNVLHFEDPLVPRLRFAYATLGGFLGGQASSNFSDPDANPETLDFGGPAGLAGVNRIPQVRYTMTGPWGSALSFSAEAPDTDVLTPAGLVEQDTNLVPGAVSNTGTAACVANGVTVAAAGGCVLAGDPARNGAPDVTFAWYWTQPWGHFDLRLVGRDLEFNDGRFSARDTNRTFDFLELAQAAARAPLPDDLKDGLAVVTDNEMHDPVFPNGCAVCEAEVDPETGWVEITRYAVVDDVGRCINPLIVHGQSHGGIAQGVGQAMWEECAIDPASGQPLCGSFMDYGMPRSDNLPSFATEIVEVLSPTNPFGIKAGGEGGCTPALAAVVSAILDALAPLGVRDITMPTTPFKVWQAIREARVKPTG